MDFTLNKYRQLLAALQQAGYSTVLRFSDDNTHRQVILRHDVDLKPQNSLRTARIEAELGLKAIYYFRMVPESYDETIIEQIATLGHEIGYHYECLTTSDGDVEKAYQDFCQNLQRFNDLLTRISDAREGRGQRSVTTICMHGSPRSPYDSKDIWKNYTYKDLGIDYEPYLDTDFSQVFYLTDTGRRWDGFNVSVRDKIPQFQDQWTAQGLTFHTTDDLLNALRNHSKFKIQNSKFLITTHPQRWNPFGFSWLKELFLQSAKNLVKSLLIRFRSR